MLRAALAFFILALISYFLGAGQIAGVSMEIGRLLLLVFIVLAAISLIAGLIGGGRGPRQIV